MDNVKKANVKLSEEFKGKVKRPFTILGKEPDKNGKGGTPDKEYKTGDDFVTKNKKFFKSLIDKKRIE